MKRLRFTEVKGLAQPGLEAGLQAGLLISSSLAFPFCSQRISNSLPFCWIRYLCSKRTGRHSWGTYPSTWSRFKAELLQSVSFCFPKGIILSVVISSDPQKPPFLLILDAKSFTEQARAYVDVEVHLDLHGLFIPDTDFDSGKQAPSQEVRDGASNCHVVWDQTGLRPWEELAGSHRTQGLIPPWVEERSFISFCVYSFSVCIETKIWR